MTRAIPTQSTEDEGSHHGLRERQRGRDRLVMRMWTQRMSVRSVGWRACGAHLALVLLLATAVVAPLP
jgi:hypothetical protein